MNEFRFQEVMGQNWWEKHKKRYLDHKGIVSGGYFDEERQETWGQRVRIHRGGKTGLPPRQGSFPNTKLSFWVPFLQNEGGSNLPAGLLWGLSEIVLAWGLVCGSCSQGSAEPSRLSHPKWDWGWIPAIICCLQSSISGRGWSPYVGTVAGFWNHCCRNWKEGLCWALAFSVCTKGATLRGVRCNAFLYSEHWIAPERNETGLCRKGIESVRSYKKEREREKKDVERSYLLLSVQVFILRVCL